MIKLTIGMPAFEDFDGVAFTLQSLRLGNDLSNVELIVVDNSPTTPQGRETAAIASAAGARYIPLPGDVGASGAKNAVFDNARGEYVLCMDCHVLLPPGTIDKLLTYYDANPTTKDFLTGPLVYDDLKNIATHFDPIWRGEMWGIWATDKRGFDPNGEPFEIWGNGCGLFSCRRDAWLGFGKDWRGFGGEEGYIHEKFRQAGHKALCLPFLRWWHRFGRPAGVKYNLTRWNKVRNYVLGHTELGLSLDPVYDHFVKSGLMQQEEWDFLVDDPVAHVSFDPLPMKPSHDSMEATYQQAANNTNSYFNQHMPKLRELAAQCETVAEITRTNESTIAIQAAKPRSLTSIWREQKDHADKEYDRCDLLFFKPHHDDHHIAETLALHHVRVNRWIAIHDIASGFFANTSDGGPGYARQTQNFLDAHPEWFVVSHDPKQYGFTVLGKQERDKPASPVVPWLLDKGYGPGTELTAILSGIGINPTSTCSCKALARNMDAMGVEGCRANIDQLAEAINRNQDGWGWKEKMTAAFKVATAGYFSIRSLVEEAIRRAEAKEKSAKVAA